MNRRDYLSLMGAAAGAAATSSKIDTVFGQQRAADNGAPTTSTIEDRSLRGGALAFRLTLRSEHFIEPTRLRRAK